jgi:hypothetical protein
MKFIYLIRNNQIEPRQKKNERKASENLNKTRQFRNIIIF